jgi:hypothetical protein
MHLPPALTLTFAAQVTTQMILATFDPEENMRFLATTLTPHDITRFTINEITFKTMSILTKQV